MAIRTIVTEKDEILRKKAKPVTQFNDKLKEIVGDLIDTMHKAEGLGLAAPQVGILRQIAVVTDEKKKKEILLINPQIIVEQGEQIREEGCLSVPGVYGNVKRPLSIVVITYGLDGKKRKITAKDLEAVAICHEIDHLNGILFRDKVIKYTKGS